jgi:hypothetical protein
MDSEHALHLAAKHFIEDVTPTPASILHKKAAHAQVEDDSEDEDKPEESVEFDYVGDTVQVGKALAFVVQVVGSVLVAIHTLHVILVVNLIFLQIESMF